MARDSDLGPEILYAPLRDLAARIRTRRLSPVALAEACLERLDTYGRRLGAVVTLTRDLALKQARAAETEIRAGKYRGPLHGIPYGAKDLLAVKGVHTTWGAEPYRDQVFDHDATVVRKLHEAGAVLVAKLAMVELAGGFGYDNADASFTGPCRTPWNTDYWSGGSSSGSGAAVGAGLVPFALGSETSGSIITPAAFCGVSGLRPTYGRVSRHGAMALSWTLDKLGPLCRTADDCGIVLAVLAGRDPLDPTTSTRSFAALPPVPKGRKPTRPDGKRFKVAVPEGATDGAQPAVKKNFEEALKVVRDFADVEEGVKFPALPFGEVVSTVIHAEMASAFRELIESGKSQTLRGANDKWGGFAASMVLAADYLDAMRLRGPMKREMDRLYARYDALVAPSRSTVSYPIALHFNRAWPGFGGGPPIIPAGNAVGQPALSVPNGFGPKGLPTGIQFTGRAWSEDRLIALAQAYQQATDWHTKRPPLPAKP